MNKIELTSHNWLIHKINNNSIRVNSGLIRGLVIDLGCGTAPYKEEIQHYCKNYVGVDWKNSFHDSSDVDIFADLNESLPLKDGCADTVVSFQTIEHLTNPWRLVSECRRILKPGGRVFITSPFMWGVHEAPHDYFRFTRHGLSEMLKKVGFVQIDIEETTGFWQTFALKFNYHTARFTPRFLKALFIPIWWFGQVVSPTLDRMNFNPHETASYTATARKPD